MKTAQLVHNPTAGDEDHAAKELIQTIESKGFECLYSSTKEKGWKKFDAQVDFLVAAGGDGTVRKLVQKLLKRKVMDRTWPIALLPLGTANNIASSLAITGTADEIIESWKRPKFKKFDVGQVHNLEETEFFLEGMGCGIFPYLISEMQKEEKESSQDTHTALNSALALLHQIVLSYEPRLCELEVDGTNHSGKFLMAEIMNTPSIGPNLVLAPDADPGDGEFEIVLIPEKYKERFAEHLTNKIAGKEEEYRYDTLKGKNIRLRWDGTHVHLDGEVLKIKQSMELEITMRAGVVDFFVS